MRKFVLTLAVLLAVIVFAACGRNRVDDPVEVDSDITVNNPIVGEPMSTPEPTPTPPVEAPVLSPAEVFAKNQHSVIQIIGTCANNWTWFGSGFIVDSSGTAVTNHHVMVGLVEASAIFYDGRELEITGFYSYDIANDIAIVQVGAGNEGFVYVTLGDSDAARVGEPVFAVGGPEGDPITFTAGMISRFANEPVSFDIYTVSGMIQSTAAIYGGNSGGPLLNDRGHVIGINSAGRPDRASVQWAVPSNRIDMPYTGSDLNPLPIMFPGQAGHSGAIPAAPGPGGEITFLSRFDFIPDIRSISGNASLILSGTPFDLGETSGLFFDFYDYLILYHIPEDHWIPDTDRFDEVLMQHGFIFQGIQHHDGDTWVYLFHPGHDISLSYVYSWGYDALLVGITTGDVYTEFYHTPPANLFPQPIPPTAAHLAGEWHTAIRTDIGWGDFDYDLVMTLNFDGIGREEYWWGGSVWATDFYNWTAENGVMIFSFPGYDPLVMPYTLVGNTLSIVDGTFTYVFERAGDVAPIAIAGTLSGEWHTILHTDIGWGFFDYDLIMTLFPDGRGLDAFWWGGEVWHDAPFNWRTENNFLIVSVPDGGEARLPYKLDGNILTVTIDRDRLVFERIGAAPVAAETAGTLLGSWVIEVNEDIGWGFFDYDYVMTFFPDGSAIEEYWWGGSVWYDDVFNWSSANGALTISFPGYDNLVVGYSIAGDALTLTIEGESMVMRRLN